VLPGTIRTDINRDDVQAGAELLADGAMLVNLQ
jgi:hypothetical protein